VDDFVCSRFGLCVCTARSDALDLLAVTEFNSSELGRRTSRKQIRMHLVCHGRNTANLLPVIIVLATRSDRLATRQMSLMSPRLAESVRVGQKSDSTFDYVDIMMS